MPQALFLSFKTTMQKDLTETVRWNGDERFESNESKISYMAALRYMQRRQRSIGGLARGSRVGAVPRHMPNFAT